MADRTEDLRRIDATLEEWGEDEDFGAQLMRSSLERRRGQAMEEANGLLDLVLTREPGGGTGGELPLLAGVLASLQDSVASIAQVLTGRPTARGVIPVEIQETVGLRVDALSPGSLKLRMVPATIAAQQNIFADSEGTLLELSVERLLDLLGRTSEERLELLSDVADLGPRVTTHIQAFSRVLSDSRANVDLSWRSVSLEKTARLHARAAGELDELLREVEERTRTLVYTGRLVGGSLIRRTFELELEPPESTVLAGRVTEEAVGPLEERFGQDVTATLEVKESRLPSGETKETHLLTHLS